MSISKPRRRCDCCDPRNAPFIIDWLDRQFKQAGRIVVPHSDLLAALAEYQEELRETDPDQLVAKPETYLADWSGPDKLWLRRFLEAGRDEPVYQLTPATEDVFVFLNRVLEQDPGFVGTESRLKLVIDTLDDLVVGASEDPEARLRHLRETQRRVQAEIEQIETEGAAPRYRPAQIRERFITAVSLLRQLQGDFRAVEESFREITRQVQQRQVEGSATRGGILGFALDSEDVLKKEDQGVSFYEFVRLILTPSQTSDWNPSFAKCGGFRNSNRSARAWTRCAAWSRCCRTKQKKSCGPISDCPQRCDGYSMPGRMRNASASRAYCGRFAVMRSLWQRIRLWKRSVFRWMSRSIWNRRCGGRSGRNQRGWNR